MIPILEITSVYNKFSNLISTKEILPQHSITLPALSIEKIKYLTPLLHSKAFSMTPPSERAIIPRQVVWEIHSAIIVPQIKVPIFILDDDTYFVALENYPDASFVELLNERWGALDLPHIPKLRATQAELKVTVPETLSRLKLKDKVAIGSLTTEDKNIFHWLYITLPKLKWLAQTEFESVKILFSYHPSSFQVDSLLKLGIPNEIIVTTDLEVLLIDQLMFSSCLYPAFCSTPYVKSLRERFTPESWSEYNDRSLHGTFPNRISAENSRLATNSNELIDFVNKFNIINVDLSKHSFESQIDIAKSSTYFLFEHGAAGAFIPFTPKNCKIIELIPSNAEYKRYGPPAHFMYLSFASERDYYPVYPEISKVGFSYPIQKLEELLTSILSEH